MTEKLKRCPFCGGEGENCGGGSEPAYDTIQCNECGFFLLRKTWNTRANPAMREDDLIAINMIYSNGPDDNKCVTYYGSSYGGNENVKNEDAAHD